MSDGFSSTLSLTNFSAGDEGRKSYRSSMLQSYQPSAFTGAPMENVSLIDRFVCLCYKE